MLFYGLNDKCVTNVIKKNKLTSMSAHIFFMSVHFASMAKSQIKDKQLLLAVVAGIKATRKKRGITQEEFYNNTGIHISRIETGKVNITLSTLKSLLSYFDVSLAKFFDEIKE